MIASRRRFLQGAIVLGASVGASPIARAQAWPTRPVRVIVPFAPGGPTDLAGRLLAQKLAEHLGKPFPVENVGGAGGNIGVGQAARATPDGHTILVAAASYAVNPSLFEKVPYDPRRDFTAVTFAATAPTVLTVHPSVPARNLRDLVALINANPGKYSYASPGPGTPPHLLGELFRISQRLDLVHVPFNGGGPAVAATLAGHVPLSFGALPPAVQHVRDGKLRAIAVTSSARAAALPDVPTSADAGFPDIAGDIWTAVLVPAGTSPEIVQQLYGAIASIVAQPDVKERLAGLGYVPVANSPAECDAQIRSELDKWAKVIRQAGITPQ